jgi:tellurite resistance protein
MSTSVLEHPDDERFHIENVEPLIVSVEPRGSQLEFVFRCPVSGFEATARVKPTQQLSDPYSGSLQPRLSSLVENALRPSSSEAGRTPSEAGANWTVGEIEEAACDAFESVSGEFLWDGMRWTHWEAEDRVVEFLEYADALEALTESQRAVLRKLLSSVALADGRVKAVEEQLVHTLLGGDAAALHAGGSPPSAAELDSIGSRTLACAVLVFGYAVACVDGHLSPAEEELLAGVCRHFGLGGLKQWELKRVAQSFVVDEAFARIYEKGSATPQERVEVYQLARGLKMTKNETRELEFRFLKRSGLA